MSHEFIFLNQIISVPGKHLARYWGALTPGMHIIYWKKGSSANSEPSSCISVFDESERSVLINEPLWEHREAFPLKVLCTPCGSSSSACLFLDDPHNWLSREIWLRKWWSAHTLTHSAAVKWKKQFRDWVGMINRGN